tara:strand:- start:324 stop:638 length:315 start_codon:yes stop_codon:yes gene_type:complete
MDESLLFNPIYRDIERTFVLSCSTFNGFTTKVVVNNYDTIDEIIKVVIERLKKTLEKNNLNILLSKLESLKEIYHVHDYTYADIILYDKIYYICSHIQDDYVVV